MSIHIREGSSNTTSTDEDQYNTCTGLDTSVSSDGLTEDCDDCNCCSGGGDVEQRPVYKCDDVQQDTLYCMCVVNVTMQVVTNVHHRRYMSLPTPRRT